MMQLLMSPRLNRQTRVSVLRFPLYTLQPAEVALSAQSGHWLTCVQSERTSRRRKIMMKAIALILLAAQAMGNPIPATDVKSSDIQATVEHAIAHPTSPAVT